MCYLASSSPRRRMLLEQIGLNFDTLPIAIDESVQTNEVPHDYVLRLAQTKANVGFTLLNSAKQKEAIVIGADTIVVAAGCMLGKPSNQQQAIEMLMQLSGTTHTVFTALAIKTATRILSRVVQTEVTMIPFSESDALAYWQTGEPFDKAGSYAIQGKAAMFIEQIKGDYYSVVGLPLCALNQLLNQVNSFPLKNNIAAG